MLELESDYLSLGDKNKLFISNEFIDKLEKFIK